MKLLILIFWLSHWRMKHRYRTADTEKWRNWKSRADLAGEGFFSSFEINKFHFFHMLDREQKTTQGWHSLCRIPTSVYVWTYFSSSIHTYIYVYVYVRQFSPLTSENELFRKPRLPSPVTQKLTPPGSWGLMGVIQWPCPRFLSDHTLRSYLASLLQ